MSHSLVVQLSETFSLNAGSFEVEEQTNHKAYHIYPPNPLLFDQVIDYLWQQPTPPYRGLHNSHLGVGFAALAVRWGSYFAALCAPEFPIYQPDIANIPDVQNEDICVIADSEMRRLNIEISANISRLGKLYREDWSKYCDLLFRAYEYLPMPARNARPNHELRKQLLRAHTVGSYLLFELRNPVEALATMKAFGISRSESSEAPIPEKPLPGEPDRVIANYLANLAWRNTEIEDFHAGTYLNIDAPLLPSQCRFSRKDERKLIGALCSNAYEVVGAFGSLYDPFFRDPDPRYKFILSHPESAEAVHHAGSYPRDWTTTDQTAEIRLTHYA